MYKNHHQQVYNDLISGWISAVSLSTVVTLQEDL